MPPLSPRTQQFQAGMNAGPDQEAQLFEQGMSDMAYNLLSSKMPDVMQDVVTFKVIKADVDKGAGVGAFIVLRNDQPIYIPVVLVDNTIKPLEVFFHKTLNIFLPLTKGWLDEIDKTALSALGKGIKTPETLYTDVDIRNVVVPPITGRFSYAAWMPKAIYDASRVVSREYLDAREKEAAEPAPMFIGMLEAAPNRVKTAFVATLKRHPRLLKTAAAFYGVAALSRAVQPRLEKVAAKQLSGGALWIADKDNTPTDFRRIFGDQAGEAYAGVRKKGFAAKDERLTRNMAVQEQPFAHWTEPNQPGVYCLYSSDGGERYAFVMPDPIDLLDDGTRYGRRPAIPAHNPVVDNSYRDPDNFGPNNKVYPVGRPNEADYATKRDYTAKPYLAAFGDGKYLMTDRLVGRSSVADDVAGRLQERLFDKVDGAPRTGKGFFVRKLHSVYQATVPVEVKSMSTGSDGVRRLKISGIGGYPEKTVCTDPTHPYGAIWMPKGADVVYLPPDFIWIPLGEKLDERGWYRSALDLQACVSSMLSAVGAKKVAIKDAGAKQFSINGMAPLSFVPALKKLAHGCNISVDDAEALLTKAASDHSATAWIATRAQLATAQIRLDKIAAGDKTSSFVDSSAMGGSGGPASLGGPLKGLLAKKPQAPQLPGAPQRGAMMGGALGGLLGKLGADDSDDKKKSDSKPKKKAPPNGGADAGPPGGDPSMGDPNLGQDAAMAAMGPPPAPPPPAPLDLAAMEMDQAIQHEMQKLMDRQQTIQQLLQRSSEIGGGAPPAASVQSQAMGAPPSSMNLATGGPGMPPGMTAGMGQPPQDPSMGAAVPPGMPPGGPFPPGAGDPSMMGGGADPSMGGMFGGMGGGMPSGGQPGMDPSMMSGMSGGMPGGDPSMSGMGGMDPAMGGGQPPPSAMMPSDGPNAQAMGQEINPQFLDQVAQMRSADMFDAAAVATLAQSPELHGVVAQYLPNLEKAVDNLARVQLTLWMQEPDLKQQIGEAAFAGIEENMQSSFKGLGDLVLRLSRGVQAVKEPDDHAA